MSKEFSREIHKLEVRLKGFVAKEEVFVKGLKKCLDKFRKLNKNLDRLNTSDPSEVEELMTLRLEASKTLCDVLIKRSEVEHEQSHMLESYGTLILALEETFQNLYPPSNEEGKNDV